MTKRLTVGAVILMVGAFALTSRADSVITPGSGIIFGGSAELNAPVSTATSFTDIFGPGGLGTDPVVEYASGTYAAVPNSTPATFHVFTFAPIPTTPFTLWSFVQGGLTYSFQVDPSSMTITKTSAPEAAFIVLHGSGTAMITGYAPAPATWSLASSQSGSTPVLTFGVSASTVVPEPSLFALLLMAPLSWLFLYRKPRQA